MHYLAHNFDRTLEVEAITRTHVQLQCDGIQLFFAVYRQVHSSGQALAFQAVDVFVAATLPRAMRVKEVDRHAGLLGDIHVSHHLPTLAVGHAPVHRQRHAIERRTEAFQRRGRRRVVHLVQHQVVTGAFHQGTYHRDVGLALDQVALPMARHQAVFDLRRAHVDADYLGNQAAPIYTTRTRPACRLTLTQTDDQLLAPLTDGQGIDRVVDRLATDVGIS